MENWRETVVIGACSDEPADIMQRGKPRIWHGAWSKEQGVLHQISVMFGKWGNGEMDKWSLGFYQPIGFLRANLQKGSNCFISVYLCEGEGV